MNIKRMMLSIRYMFHFDQMKRADFARKHRIFHYVGENVRLPMSLVPYRSDLISFHNNIEIASGVKFITHDAIHGVLNFKYHGEKENNEFPEQLGCIEIMDNVFVGSGTTILGNVRIGPNVIIGANSLVNCDVPEGTIYAGSPAKQIGTFEALVEKRKKIQIYNNSDEIWTAFKDKRK